MNSTDPKYRVSTFLATLGFLLGTTLLAMSWQTSQAVDDWRYFPSNLQANSQQANERLALISRGSGQTYTPATFLLKPDSGKDYIDIQIWDAPTHEESQTNNVDFVRNGVHEMDIIIKNAKNAYCRINNLDKTIDDSDKSNRLNGESSSCEGTPLFKKNTDKSKTEEGWSETIRIYPSGSTAEIVTVWNGLEANDIISNVPNTFNIFSLRSQNGTITVKPTDFNNTLRFTPISGLQDPSVRPNPTKSIWNRIQSSSINLLQNGEYKTITDKIYYDSSINWVTPYAIGPSATFAFDLDVSGLPENGELIIFEKDADASKLHGAGNPPDPGIQMKVYWKQDNSKLTPWSYLDQSKYDKSNVPFTGFYVESETNAYQGPSGDLTDDQYGDKSIQWYKFPINERTTKGNFVRVEWTGSSSETNFFGFATNVPMYSSDSEAPPDESSGDFSLTCPADGFIDIAFRESTLIKVNNDFEPVKHLDFEEWDQAKARGDTKAEPPEYRIYGVSPKAQVKDARSGKTYQIKHASKSASSLSEDQAKTEDWSQWYIDLEVDPDTHPTPDKAPVARIKVSEVQLSILRDSANRDSPPRLKGTPDEALSASQHNVRGVMIGHNVTRQFIPKHIRDKITATGRNVQYYTGNEATMDMLEVQSWGRGGSDTKYNEFVDLVVMFPCGETDKERVETGFHSVYEQNVENGQRLSNCKYSDSKIDRDGIRYDMLWWDPDKKNTDHLGCDTQYEGAQYIKDPNTPSLGKLRTNFSLKHHAVQFLPRVRPADDTAVIFFGKIRGSEEPVGDELEFIVTSNPPDESKICDPNPPAEDTKRKKESCANKTIDYFFEIRNVGTKPLTNVTLHVEDPNFTKKHPDQPSIKIPLEKSLDVSTPDSDPLKQAYKVTLSVPASTVNETISSKGKFYLTALEFTDTDSPDGLKHFDPDKVICHKIGLGDPSKEQECKEGDTEIPDDDEPPCDPTKPPPPGEPKCNIEIGKTVTVEINSDPLPLTNQLRTKGIQQIKYFVTVINTTDKKPVEGESNVTLQNVEIQFSPPDFTIFPGNGVINIGPLQPGIGNKKTKEFIVDIDYAKAKEEETTITTKDKVHVEVKETDENLKKLNERLKAKTIEHYLGNGPNGPKCGYNQDKTLEACISSYPPNETKKSKEKWDVENKMEITYTITLTNRSDQNQPEHVIQFQPPENTTIVNIKSFQSTSGGSYAGEKGQIILKDGLGKNITSTPIDITVKINNQVNDNYTISTDSRIFADLKLPTTPDDEVGDISASAKTSKSIITLPAQKHHIGNGSESTKLTRCYEYGDGEWDCADYCEDLSTNSKIVIMDEIENTGGETLKEGYVYYPKPLPKEFQYDDLSIRIGKADEGQLSKRLEAVNNGLSDDIQLSGSNLKLVKYSKDSAQFPPAGGGIEFPFDVAPGKKIQIYFVYNTPEAPGCFPTDEEKAEPPIPEHEYTKIDEYLGDCVAPGEEKDICTKFVNGPLLDIRLTSSPPPGSYVRPGDTITYILQFILLNDKKVTDIEILEGPGESADLGNLICNDEEGCKASGTINFGEKLNGSSEFRFEYKEGFKVDPEILKEIVTHPGYKIRYRGKNLDGKLTEWSKAVETDSIEHLVVVPEIDEDDFVHDISLSRTTVINASTEDASKRLCTGGPGTGRCDLADESTISHVIRWAGRKKQVKGVEYPYPKSTKGDKLENHTVEYKNHCDVDGDPNYHKGKEAEGYFTAAVLHDAAENTELIIYRSQKARKSIYTYYQDIFNEKDFPDDDKDGEITFTITTELPNERPKLLNRSGETEPSRGKETRDTFTYTLSAVNAIEKFSQTNYFMLYGGVIDDKGIMKTKDGSKAINTTAIKKTVTRAIVDGELDKPNEIGKIETSNNSIVYEERWIYTKLSNTPLKYKITCYETVCPEIGPCHEEPRPVTPKLLEWVRQPNIETIYLNDTDTEYITVLGSAAWLKTMNGNLGFGAGNWQESTVPLGGANKVELTDKFVGFDFKLYTPPDDYNADFFIYAPAPVLDRLRTRYDGQGTNVAKINIDAYPNLAFIPNPRQPGEYQLSRGEAYDRDENPRDYKDDLINRELFGRVVRYGDSEWPTEIEKVGTSFQVSAGDLTVCKDCIYLIPGKIIFGQTFAPNIPNTEKITIDGGKARLYVEGNATINANIFYKTNSGDNVPSVRLHTEGDIEIGESVTDIELMMLSEGTFSSGKSSIQLRILGDVISKKTNWQRTPLKGVYKEEVDVNNPSELIIEDMRKYILTPPGDKMLPDNGNIWREVHPGTGKPLLEDLLK